MRRQAGGYGSAQTPQQGPDIHSQANPGNATMANADRQAVRGYAAGGQIGAPPAGADGAPGTPGMSTQSGPMNPQMADAHIQDMLTRNPQVGQQIKQAIQQAIQSGRLDPNVANMAIQLAQACVQNPQLWPRLRQFAIQQGLVGPNDLPQQYDEGLVLTILIGARAAQGMDMSGGGQPQGGVPGGPQMSEQGGLLQGPGTGTSDSIPATNLANGGRVNVSNGEYVIPARVVNIRGREFFDRLVQKYNGKPPAA